MILFWNVQIAYFMLLSTNVCIWECFMRLLDKVGMSTKNEENIVIQSLKGWMVMIEKASNLKWIKIEQLAQRIVKFVKSFKGEEIWKAWSTMFGTNLFTSLFMMYVRIFCVIVVCYLLHTCVMCLYMCYVCLSRIPCQNNDRKVVWMCGTGYRMNGDQVGWKSSVLWKQQKVTGGLRRSTAYMVDYPWRKVVRREGRR